MRSAANIPAAQHTDSCQLNPRWYDLRLKINGALVIGRDEFNICGGQAPAPSLHVSEVPLIFSATSIRYDTERTTLAYSKLPMQGPRAKFDAGDAAKYQQVDGFGGSFYYKEFLQTIRSLPHETMQFFF